MVLKRNIIFNLILYFVFCINCAPTRLSFQKKSEIERNPYGSIIFSFNDNIIREDFRKNAFGGKKEVLWLLDLVINNETYFYGGFGSNNDYKIPIPIGTVEIKYHLVSANDSYRYASNDKNIVILNIKNNDIFRFNIITVGKGNWGLGCIGTQVGIPWPKYYQEVAFEVEKLESDTKNKKSHDTNSNPTK